MRSIKLVDTIKKVLAQHLAIFIAIIAEYSHLKNADVIRSITPAALNPDGALHMPSLREDLEIFRRQGLIEGAVSVEQAVDASFAQEAVKALGAYKPSSGH